MDSKFQDPRFQLMERPPSFISTEPRVNLIRRSFEDTRIPRPFAG